MIGTLNIKQFMLQYSGRLSFKNVYPPNVDISILITDCSYEAFCLVTDEQSVPPLIQIC